METAIFNGGEWQSNGDARILVPAGELEKTAPLNGEIEIVIVLNAEGQPVSGERLRFDIVGG